MGGPGRVRPGLSPSAGTPDKVVVDGDPQRLLERVRAANRGGDVHLIGGPRTIETFRRLGAPEHERALPTGAVELAHACT